jgi:hypothetical protein
LEVLKDSGVPADEAEWYLDSAHSRAHPGPYHPADRRFEDDEADFQRHYRSGFTRCGLAYEHWALAYRYGYVLATDPRYAGRDWEARHQGSWEEFKDAVLYAWEHVHGRHHTNEGDVHVPVIEEELRVGTREVERGGV